MPLRSNNSPNPIVLAGSIYKTQFSDPFVTPLLINIDLRIIDTTVTYLQPPVVMNITYVVCDVKEVVSFGPFIDIDTESIPFSSELLL